MINGHVWGPKGGDATTRNTCGNLGEAERSELDNNNETNGKYSKKNRTDRIVSTISEGVILTHTDLLCPSG